MGEGDISGCVAEGCFDDGADAFDNAERERDDQCRGDDEPAVLEQRANDSERKDPV